VNLRDAYLPYKSLIGQVILDKNPSIRTVINKADTLNSDNEYRVLDFEVIAGDHDFLVETRETGAIFRFDYSKVFWNSRLSTEHERLVNLFEPGEMVCDVMAGVGPFAVPAGKKGVFVWANDLNPYTDECLREAIRLNKVSLKMIPTDIHTYIIFTKQARQTWLTKLAQPTRSQISSTPSAKTATPSSPPPPPVS